MKTVQLEMKQSDYQLGIPKLECVSFMEVK